MVLIDTFSHHERGQVDKEALDKQVEEKQANRDAQLWDKRCDKPERDVEYALLQLQCGVMTMNESRRNARRGLSALCSKGHGSLPCSWMCCTIWPKTAPFAGQDHV